MKIKSINEDIIDKQNSKQKKINITTKCAKMTEESDFIRRNGIINGANVNNNNNNSLINNTFLLTRNNNQLIDENVGGSSGVVSYKTAATNNDTTTTTNSGNDCSPGTSNKPINNIATNAGGRLQFFKDGKFILELARAREGDKTGWVSVPRKTYWPPTAPTPAIPSVNYHKNESSTSLSFSDDNSSIQSSPWQRDHCWKQSSPRRSISKEMNLFYYRPFSVYNKLTNEIKKFTKLKCRRPYDLTAFEIKLIHLENGTKNKKLNSKQDEKDDSDRSYDCVDGAEKNADDKIININIDNKNDTNNSNIDDKKYNLKKKKIFNNRPKLNNIIQKLINKIPVKTTAITGSTMAIITPSPIGSSILSSTAISASTNISNNIINYSIQAQPSRLELQQNLQHVSPRKRILRELEKVSLDDITILKRSRAKTTTNSGSFNNNNNMITTSSLMSPTSTPPVSSTNINSIQTINYQQTNSNNNCNKVTNGVIIDSRIQPPIIQPQSVSRPISSYSITSLLGHNNNNNSSTSHNIQSKELNMSDPSQLRAMLTSPKSPEYTQNKNVFDKKRSPNYSNIINLSSKIIGSLSTTSTITATTTTTTSSSFNRYNNDKSPSSNILDSPYNLISSPGLTPSPEHNQQNFHRFRHYNTHHIPSSSSSPNNYHPYMSSSSSSRCSPAGTISPTSDLYNSRYRTSNFLLGSPNNHQYQTTSATATTTTITTTTSTSINNCRNTSPLYSHHSPQQLYNNNCKHVISSPTHHLNNLNITVNKIIESPSLSPNSEYHYHTQRHSSHHQHGGLINTKSNSKKTASQRQQQQYSGVNTFSSSLSHNTNTDYNKSAIGNNKNDRITPTTQLAGRHNSPEKLKDLEYLGSNNILSGLDIDPNLMIRPQMVPSLSQQHQQQQSQSMFFMHPSYQNPNLGPPYIPYYNQMHYASAASIAAYRNSLWMHYPVHSSRIPMMPYPGIGLSSSGHNLTTSPWNQISTTTIGSEPVSLVRMKDESSSDVPLNLSKH